jgi:ketosteroid isomerase-like protein
VSEGDIAVVREQFDAVNRRDFGRAMELYADDVVMYVPWTEGVPNPGVHKGKEAVGEWFADWFRTFDRDYRFKIEEARELGDLIFLFATHGGRGRASGAEVHGSNAYLHRVRDGKVVQVGFFDTREQALEAASLPEWSEAETH